MHAHEVAAQLDLIGFVMLGLLGSAGHCAGMCSPFVLLVSTRYAGTKRSHTAAQLWYAAGRITTYAVLGATAGALGGIVEWSGRLIGLQRSAAALAGAALVITAAISLTDRGGGAGTLHGRYFGRMMTAVRTRFPGHPLLFGLLLGLLPCGLVYTAVVAAVARGGAVDGAIALAAFGAGTFPSLFGIAMVNQLLVRRPLWNRGAQAFVLLMGVWFLWQGLTA